MQNLRAFNEYFHEHADKSVRQLWKYAEYETKFGTRCELALIGGAVVVLELPDDSLEFLAIQTKEHRIYKHAGYLMAMLAEYYLTDRQELQVRIKGSGYQAFAGVTNVKVEALNAEGTVERVNRFGQQSELPVSKINGVRLSRLTKEKT